MIHSLLVIFKNEYRELRLVTAIFAGIGVMTFVYLLVMPHQYAIEQMRYIETISWNLIVYAAIHSAIMFVRDVEQGTVELYRRLPISKHQLAAGKLLYLLVAILILGLFLFGLNLIGLLLQSTIFILYGGYQPFSLQTNTNFFGSLMAGFLFVVPVGIFWSTHLRNTMSSLLLTLITPIIILALIAPLCHQILEYYFWWIEIELSLSLFSTVATVFWGTVLSFAVCGALRWPAFSERNNGHSGDDCFGDSIQYNCTSYSPALEQEKVQKTGRWYRFFHGPTGALVREGFLKDKTLFYGTFLWFLFFSCIFFPCIKTGYFGCVFGESLYVFSVAALGINIAILTSQIFLGRDTPAERQILNRLGVSASLYLRARMILYGGFYTLCVLIFGLFFYLSFGLHYAGSYQMPWDFLLGR